MQTGVFICFTDQQIGEWILEQNILHEMDNKFKSLILEEEIMTLTCARSVSKWQSPEKNQVSLALGLGVGLGFFPPGYNGGTWENTYANKF